jgi:hypothetical protein
MNIPELKKSMEDVKELEGRGTDEVIHLWDRYKKSLETLLSACQLLCDVSDSMLPKKDIPSLQNLLDDYNSGYNLARSEDIQFFAKKMMGLEGAIEEIFDRLQWRLRDTQTGDWIDAKDLVNAIRQEMGGGE